MKECVANALKSMEPAGVLYCLPPPPGLKKRLEEIVRELLSLPENFGKHIIIMDDLGTPPSVIKIDTDKIISGIDAACIYDKEKAKKFGEIHTPWKIVNEMCDAFPAWKWKDPTNKWLDPCAGLGRFPAVLVRRLMEGIKEIIPDEITRYRHIMEKQIYMCELQRENAIAIDRIFNPNKSLRLNLYVGDFLKMPKDSFAICFEDRIKKYPENFVGWQKSCTQIREQ